MLDAGAAQELGDLAEELACGFGCLSIYGINEPIPAEAWGPVADAAPVEATAPAPAAPAPAPAAPAPVVAPSPAAPAPPAAAPAQAPAATAPQKHGACRWCERVAPLDAAWGSCGPCARARRQVLPLPVAAGPQLGLFAACGQARAA